MVAGEPGDLSAAFAACGARIVGERALTLEEIFFARVGSGRAAAAEG